MRRRVWIWTVVLLLAYWARTFAADWTVVADRVAKSVVLVQNDSGLCTGFITDADHKNDKDESVDRVLTAAHCEGANLFADQEPAKIVYKDTKRDLMVLEIGDTGRPALHIAKDDPKVGAEILSYGFGYANVVDQALARVAHVSADKLFIASDGIGGPLIATDATFVNGQSGGPCVNVDGDVVMIVQMGTNSVGMGVGAETIKSKTGRYWEKPKAAKP